MRHEMLALSDKEELHGIAGILAESVRTGEYSINEAILEVMPFEYCLADYEQSYIRELVQSLTGQLVEE